MEACGLQLITSRQIRGKVVGTAGISVRIGKHKRLFERRQMKPKRRPRNDLTFPPMGVGDLLIFIGWITLVLIIGPVLIHYTPLTTREVALGAAIATLLILLFP